MNTSAVRADYDCALHNRRVGRFGWVHDPDQHPGAAVARRRARGRDRRLEMPVERELVGRGLPLGVIPMARECGVSE